MRRGSPRLGGIPEIVRAVIYARVSKDDSGRARSCKEQIKSCTADCEYEGWPIGEVLQDNDRGATRYSKREREDFQRLPKILRTGDVLVVWEPSRITREMGEFSVFCDMVADRAVLLYYDGRIWDMRDDDDRNRVWQDILDGVKSAAKTRKRVLRAMADNLEERKPHGKRPPGYDIVRDARTGEPLGRAINPGQQRILRECAAGVLAQDPTLTLAELSRRHAAQWAAAGGTGAFRGADIRRMLLSSTTFGLRESYGEIIGPGTWEPVLDIELMQPLRAILTDPARRTQRGTDPVWLLSYIALCGVCLSRGEERTVRCHASPRKGPGRDPAAPEYQHGGHIVRNQRRVDDHVEELLLQLLEDPDTVEMLTAADRVDEGYSVTDDLAEIERLRAAKQAFIVDAARARMAASDVAVYTNEVDRDIRQIEERLSAARGAPASTALQELAEDPWTVWEDWPVERRRSVIRSCMTIVIDPLGRAGRPRAGVPPPIGVTVRPIGQLARLIEMRAARS